MSRRAVAAVGLVLLGLAGLRLFGPLLFPVDRCLDRGGAWNLAEEQCEGARR